jgi:predicted dehydrogenase
MRLLILGTGGMAKYHAQHFSAISGVTVVAGVDVDPDRLDAFTAEHKIERGFPSLEAALDWGGFDAVTNVTPDAIHRPTTIAALRAGKHVFCEKPLSTDAAKAFEMVDAAEQSGLVNMVNLTYRNVAQLQMAREIVASGQIGAVKHVEASYLQSWLASKAWGDWRTDSSSLWRLSKKHSNGVLGDIGIHIVDFVSFGSGLDVDHVFARLKTYDKAPNNRIGEYDLDANDSFNMSVEFSNGALGVIHATRWASGHLNELRLRVYGETGGVEVQHRHNGSTLRVSLGDDIETGNWKEVETPKVLTNYERFATAVATGVNQQPDFRHAARLQKLLDLAMVSDIEHKDLSTNELAG